MSLVVHKHIVKDSEGNKTGERYEIFKDRKKTKTINNRQKQRGFTFVSPYFYLEFEGVKCGGPYGGKGDITFASFRRRFVIR